MRTYTCEVCRRANRPSTTLTSECYFCGSVYSPVNGEMVLIEEKELPRPVKQPTVRKKAASEKPASPEPKPSVKTVTSTAATKAKPQKKTIREQFAPYRKKRQFKILIKWLALISLSAGAFAFRHFYPADAQKTLNIFYQGIRHLWSGLLSIFYLYPYDPDLGGWQMFPGVLALEVMIMGCASFFKNIFFMGASHGKKSPLDLDVNWSALFAGIAILYLPCFLTVAITHNPFSVAFWVLLAGDFFIIYSKIDAIGLFMKKFIYAFSLIFIIAGLIAGDIFYGSSPDAVLYTYLFFAGSAMAGYISGTGIAILWIKIAKPFKKQIQDFNDQKEWKAQRLERERLEQQVKEKQERERLERERQERAATARLLEEIQERRRAEEERENDARIARYRQEEDTRLRNLRILFFDTETADLIRDRGSQVYQGNAWPRLLQLCWKEYNGKGEPQSGRNLLIRPEGFAVSSEAFAIHQISTSRAAQQGVALQEAMSAFNTAIARADVLVGHNTEFDVKVIQAELIRLQLPSVIAQKRQICTMKSGTAFCAIPRYDGTHKYPTLTELHQKLFNTGFAGAHDAEADITATAKCFWELKRRSIVKI